MDLVKQKTGNSKYQQDESEQKSSNSEIRHTLLLGLGTRDPEGGNECLSDPGEQLHNQSLDSLLRLRRTRQEEK
jgi:hypothetical protein